MKNAKTKGKAGNNEDIRLIKLIKNKNCNDSFKKIDERHGNLFYSICNKFSNKLDVSEIYKDKNFVIFRAIISFDANRGAKFSTWLGNYTRYHCLNYIKNNHKYVISDDDKITHFFNNKSLEDYDDRKDMKNDLDHAFDILSKMNDPRIFKIFKLRYLHNGPKLTWKQIAKEFNLTPQTIINLHSKGRRALKRKMKKDNLNP
jgi:RNA polymerase sigma factor (sigma-70 family)